MKPALAYMRVSSEEQAKVGYSIPFQRARTESFAREHDFELQEVIEDVHSAKQVGRPGFARLLRYLEEHPEVRDIVVHRVDRLIRNHYEYGLVVEQLGVRVHSVVEPAEDNAAGRLMHGMNVVVAKYHSDNLSQEVRKGLRSKFEAGGCISRAPVGYKSIPKTRTVKGTVVVDPERAPLVKLMFERYATRHFSLRTLAVEMLELGLGTKTGQPFPPEQVRQMLSQPFYKGLVSYEGETRPGAHPAIVDPDLWELVQQVLCERSEDHGEKGKKFFLLRGILRCESCRTRVTAEDHERGSYYRCLHNHKSQACGAPLIPVAPLDAEVEAMLPGLVMREADRTRVLGALVALKNEREAVRRREEASLVARRSKLETRLSRLTDALTDAILTRDHFRAKRTEYERELATVNGRLKVLTTPLGDEIELVKIMLGRATALFDLYTLAEPANRKLLLKEIFKAIYVHDRKITKIEFNPPFDLILNGVAAEGDAGQKISQLLEYAAEHHAEDI